MWADLLVGGLLVALGYGMCYMLNIREIEDKQEEKQDKQENYTLKKRVKPNMGNPIKTYDVYYEKYKSKNNLYEPLKPKKTDGVPIGKNWEE